MALANPPSEAFDFAAAVARAYAGLVGFPLADPRSALGGKLLYAGELNDEARALLVAANIAGAATLAATADRAAQKQALRDGVADFVVNNLDEALRILKNQLRKRETVAVCVALPAGGVEREMDERGVVPDLLRQDLHIAARHEALMLQEGENTELDLRSIPALVTWRAASGLPNDLARLDEIALACLDPNDWKSSRWLRLAPRYLGRLAQGLRLLDSSREFAARFIGRARPSVAGAEITFAFEIQSTSPSGNDDFRFDPQSTAGDRP